MRMKKNHLHRGYQFELTLSGLSFQINVRPGEGGLFIWNIIYYICFVGLIQKFRIVRTLTGARLHEILNE